MVYRIVCKRGLGLLERREAVGRLEFQQRRPGCSAILWAVACRGKRVL